MARILVSLRNGWRRPDDFNAMPPFYETFLKGLRDAGNNVFCFQHKEYHRDFSNKMPESMIKIIKQFDPELCILFNNTFWDISELVDCPILIYDVDSPIEYTHIDNLKDKPDRYKFIINQKQGAELMKSAFGARDENIFYVPFFTDIRKNDNATLKNNIVFLGSNWTWKGYNFLSDFLKKNPNENDLERAKEVLNFFSKFPYENSKTIYKQLGIHPQTPIDLSDNRRVAYEISGLYRIKVLSAIADLGLEVRGQYWNIDCMNFYPEVLSCVNKTPTYSKQENEDFYNSAKISINTQHIQTVSGFSFRVCDVMASNACLVTSPSKDLEELFPNVHIPMFTSPQEAREICEKLLKDEEMRKDIVAASQEAIDSGYRVNNAIEIIEQLSGIKLLNNKNTSSLVSYEMEIGSLDIYSDEDPNSIVPLIRTKAPIFVPPKGKKITLTTKEQKASHKVAVENNNNIEKTKKINPLCLAWYNTLGKHLGYDPYDRFPKKTFYLGKLLIFEKFYPYSGREEKYFLSFPLISKTIIGNKTITRLLFFEKLWNLCKKIFGKNNKNQVVKVTSQTNNLVMPTGDALKLLMRKKEENRVIIRKKLKDGEKIVVCLFVCRTSCWFFDNLYKKLEESNCFTPYVVVKPFLTMGKEAMIEYMNNTYDDLSKKGYRIIKTYNDETGEFLDIKTIINPDIVFYTKYWPPQFRQEYYINNFMDKLTFYVPYAFDIGRHNEVYTFDLLNNVDRFLYNTPIHKEMAEKYMPNKGKNVYIVGSPKLDVFFNSNYVPTDPWKQQEKKKKRIIWAPHHEDKTKEDMYQFDAFYYICDFMIKMAEKYKEDIQIAFKPHPMLKPKLEYRWGKEATEEYYNKWDTLSNGQLEEGDFTDLFITSDAMILDSVSFIAEYMAVNKPALFTVSKTSRVLFNEFGEQAYKELYHTNPDSLEKDIESFITEVVINNKDVKQERRTNFINQYLLPQNNKTATENIYDSILDEINRR